MVFLKYSILFFLFSTAWAAPTLDECFQQDFSLQVSHKVKPFGLLQNNLSIKKQGCVITVLSNRYRYLNKRWVIDVCRGPIHIKFGTSYLDVFKRLKGCKTPKTQFCKSYRQLMQILEDDGLIFAAGNRNNITSEHGQVYCSFMLIKDYLELGHIMGENVFKSE